MRHLLCLTSTLRVVKYACRVINLQYRDPNYLLFCTAVYVIVSALCVRSRFLDLGNGPLRGNLSM